MKLSPFYLKILFAIAVIPALACSIEADVVSVDLGKRCGFSSGVELYQWRLS